MIGIEDYADLKGKPFFPGLIKYMASGPVVAMVWQGLDAVKTGRVMLGATNPLQSPVGKFEAPSYHLPSNILFQVRSVATSALPLAATSATVLIPSRVLRRKSSCRCYSHIALRTLIGELYSWFPEGVVQYTSAMESWIFE